MGGLILVALYQTIVVSQGGSEERSSKTVIGLGVILALSAFFPVVSGEYTSISQNALSYEYGLGALLFAPYLLLLAVVASKIGIKKLHSRQSVRERKQTITVFSALFMSALWALLFIVIIPTLTQNDSLIFIGYFAPFIFTALMYYAIVWLGLLDFRQIVARSIGYILSLFALGAMFVAALQLTVRFIVHNEIASEEALLFAVISFVLALFFQPAKKFFDKLTLRIFYHDAYDSEKVLSKLSRILIGVSDLDDLTSRVTKLLTNEMSITYAKFELNHPTNQLAKNDKSLTESSPVKIFSLLKKTHRREDNILLTELLSSGDNKNLTDYFRENDISAIVRLLAANKNESTELGYLILGQKKSGDMYTKQDHDLLKIVSNEISLAIQNVLHYEEIQQFNVTLQEKVDTATRELQATNDKLKKLDETKDEFISMASHQLRTPLTSVKGYLSMVIDGDVGRLNAQQKDLLTQSYLSSQRMANLISDLLNLSRLSTGKFVIDYSQVDLRQLIDQEIRQLKETAAARGVKLQYTPPESFPLAYLDDNKTHQVVMNFIDNAIYYTPAGGTVTVELEETDTAIEFRVTDTGIGVPREMQRHLFTKFYRADNARKARPDGTGLGLFMAKKVILAQGGSVIFESEENKGSTFGFRFSKEVLDDPGRRKPVELRADSLV